MSTIVSRIVLRCRHLHLHLTGDHDLDGIQKFHAQPVPRIGGLGVLIGLWVAVLTELNLQIDSAHFALSVLLVSMPAFLAGFMEDLTNKISVRHRLSATALSAVLGGVFLGAWLTKIEIPGLDPLLSIGVVSVVFTAFAVAGVANAFNIIDGYNGLSSMVAIIILLGMAHVAGQVGDHAIRMIAFAVAAAIFGFWVWNYPLGLIFLGDGGAYLIGFLVAELSVLLVTRNANISPWFPVLLAFYPIFETLFTIFRRVFIHKTHPGLPDAEHLHQLIYGWVQGWTLGNTQQASAAAKIRQNSLTSPFLWLIASLTVIPAVLFYQNTQALRWLALMFALVYILLYRGLVIHLRKRKINTRQIVR